MIHLDVHTDFSFLRGYGTPEQVLSRAEAIGAPVIGIADWCSTWGHIPFWHAAKGKQVQILYGVQIPVVPTLGKDPRHDVVTLLPHNDEELSRLYDLVTTAHEQTYYRPRLTWEQVNSSGLEIIVNDIQLGNLNYFKRGYLGLAPKINTMQKLCLSGEWPVVFAMGPRFPRPEDRPACDLLHSIGAGRRLGEAPFDGHHMASLDEARALFRRMGIDLKQEWISNVFKISEECGGAPQKARNIRPARPAPLLDLCKSGANRLGVNLDDPLYSERLGRELAVIKEKNFEDYFYLVHDLVAWAKDRMLVGPGRGSSGGSLVCFLLGITTIDPIRHGTMFERFIDITRNDWPDIDIDFPDTQRDDVFAYLKSRYGEERVARIGTVSEFGGKSAINDTGKATGIPWDVLREAGRWTEGVGVSLGTLMDVTPDLQTLIQKHPTLSLARFIDGHARHTGVHAAGVIVSEDPVRRSAVVNREGVASVTLEDAERINLLKIDALGLRTLSVVTEACNLAKLDPFSMYQLPLDDPKVYEIFQRDRVTGVFQFEGHAVRSLMKGMTVDAFDDLVALVALARPGPLVGGAAGEYVSRRSGHKDWQYEHPLLEAHTGDTYGTIVYQEQVMSIVRDIGGFDVVEVNKFRKAVGKKDPETLKSFRERWLRGSVDKLGEKIADSLWEQMCEFGSYAFNKSHSVAYAVLAYWCAYLKRYHGVEFAVAQLRHAASDDQGRALLRELVAEGHRFIPFDPDLSEASWSIQDGTIIGGFESVIGIGKITAKALLQKRQEHGRGLWLMKLTPAQRGKILAPNNTPWHDLDRIHRLYKDLYENPDAFNIRGGVQKIGEIPEAVGNYCFIGTLRKRQKRDKNEGKPENEKIKNAVFCNLYFEDDTGELGATINRFKYDQLGAPLFEGDNPEGKDFLVRGAIIENGRKWIFIEKLLELTPEWLAEKRGHERDRTQHGRDDGRQAEGSSAEHHRASGGSGEAAEGDLRGDQGGHSGGEGLPARPEDHPQDNPDAGSGR